MKSTLVVPLIFLEDQHLLLNQLNLSKRIPRLKIERASISINFSAIIILNL